MSKIFKVSYVVQGSEHPGAILSTHKQAKKGDRITLGQKDFIVLEVFPLVPPRGDFHYLHVTLKPADG